MVEVPGGVTVKKFVVGAVIGVVLATAERALAADDNHADQGAAGACRL